jgi:uncharacterized protein YacL (UPF0231 family)
MMPCFIVTPTGKPEAIWENPKDPRALMAHFIGSEIYLMLSTIDDFATAVHQLQQGEMPSWQWQGNSHSVVMTKDHCSITFHYPDVLSEGEPAEIELPPEDLVSVLSSWKAFILQSGLGHR